MKALHMFSEHAKFIKISTVENGSCHGKTCWYTINANDKSWKYEKLFFGFFVIEI